MDAEMPRRTFIGWVVTSLVIRPFNTPLITNTSWRDEAPLFDRGDWLFATRVPARAKQLVTRFASGVYASVYELRAEEARGIWSTQRWLCIAFEDEPGEFSIQTSGSALHQSTNWHPIDVDVNVLEGGDVEVVEDLLRGNSTTRWGRSGSYWELVAMRSAGISAHMFYIHEYDRKRGELIVRTGDPGHCVDELATERHAVAETFTLASYGRRPIVT